MKFLKNNKGYNIIEVLIVASVMSIIIVVGASNFSSKFALRRSVDDTTHKITSTLQFIKLKAGREGVEYQAELDFDPVTQVLTITTNRGDSNINSANFTEEDVNEVKLLSDVIIVPSTHTLIYRPNGTIAASGVGDLAIHPLAGSVIEKCGGISINRFGRLNIVNGNWDYNTNECHRIGDDQAVPN